MKNIRFFVALMAVGLLFGGCKKDEGANTPKPYESYTVNGYLVMDTVVSEGGSTITFTPEILDLCDFDAKLVCGNEVIDSVRITQPRQHFQFGISQLPKNNCKLLYVLTPKGSVDSTAEHFLGMISDVEIYGRHSDGTSNIVKSEPVEMISNSFSTRNPLTNQKLASYCERRSILSHISVNTFTTEGASYQKYDE